jgi:hypothetical protein
MCVLNFAHAQTLPEETEAWEPVPPVITVDKTTGIPNDAIVLFDGTNLDAWTNEGDEKPNWSVKDGILTVNPGSGPILTKQQFADCQLHLEWRAPKEVIGEGQNRGNSGIWLQNRYEVQVLDSYQNPTYSNGQAASIYKQAIPLVNACHKPGEWQSYDIIYKAPRFNNDSSLLSPAYITVLHNGVLVQNNAAIKGITTFIGEAKYTKHPFKQPLSLQDHGSPVSYRNIWVRELGVKKLFNQTNLEGWYTFDNLGKNNDPDGNYSVKDGLLHIEGKRFGYVCTKESYADYYLKVVFKWGMNKYPPRENDKRDSGILYHFADTEDDIVWPKSIECQVQEGDCGDFWCVRTMVDSPNKSEQHGEMKHIVRSENYENPHGEWNTIEVICNGGQIEHYVNDHLVNSASNASVQKGKILLQSEGAEVMYKSVELIDY